MIYQNKNEVSNKIILDSIPLLSFNPIFGNQDIFYRLFTEPIFKNI